MGPLGLQVLAASFNPEAGMLVNNFNKQFVTGFPSGFAERDAVLEYLQLSDPRFFVPILVFIDKKGMVRAQYIGDAEFLKDQEKNIRALADSLLKEPAATTAKRVAKRK
ncbi:MAG: hypothetical protein M3Z36_03740 [Acidobacteriota bacterium]|nr:hypothetical protein [Acidobacteriota bacterium]